MMEFTQNDWDQRDVINKNILWTKLGTDTIHPVIPMKYQKHTSTTILKHANILDKVNKSPYMSLLNMTPHDAYSITIHVRTMSISEISHDKKE